MKTEEANKKMSSSHNVKDYNPSSSEAVTTFDENIEKLLSKQASSALLGLLFYSILMFTLPFGAFFGTQHLFRIYSDFSEFAITSLSVASAVVTVYVIIFLYVHKAYKEKEISIPGDAKSKKKN